MTNPKDIARRVERQARLRWVPIGKMRVSPLAQRELNAARVEHIARTMDLEQLGTPTVNERDGHFYIIDGQHRVEALRQWLGEDCDAQTVQCWAYSGLNETDEAEKFLKLNDTLTVNAMAKFKVGVQADRPLETDIDRIVRAQGLCVTSDKIEGGVRAVGTLRRVYEREGAASLAKALGIIRDAYGSAGFEAPVIDGVGYLCGRYNGELDVPNAVMRLASAHGGVNGLLNNAEVLRRQTGNPRGQCVAAAAVDLINRGRGGKKLPSWWKGDEGDAGALKATG
jgi:hypothetical protein